MNREREIKEEIDFISRLNGYGSIDSAQSNNIKGINIHLTGTPAPANQDSYGITFFTRPRLNLSYDNLLSSRLLTPLAYDNDASMARAIRNMLDPVGENPSRGIGATGEPLFSRIFDSKQAFIPILTNNLLSISGWPDITLDTYTSKEGIYKESYSMVDGTSYLYNVTDVTANFRNIQGDPVTLLITAWCHYASLVYNGTAVPYPDSVIANEIDYNTRIYRLVLDYDFLYVQKIAACGAAFPTASPLGAAFNFNSDAEFNRDNDQISVPFRCIGFNYLDPILIEEFNATVQIFNKQMIDGTRDASMKKISTVAKYNESGIVGETDQGGAKIGVYLQSMLSSNLYPRINPETYELEWYTENAYFTAAYNKLRDKGVIQSVEVRGTEHF